LTFNLWHNWLRTSAGPDARIGVMLPGLAICNSLLGPRRPGGWEPSDRIDTTNEAFGHLLRQPNSVGASGHRQTIWLQGPAFSFGKTDSLEITQHFPKGETDTTEDARGQTQPIQSWGVPEPVSRWSSSSDEGNQADIQKT